MGEHEIPLHNPPDNRHTDATLRILRGDHVAQNVSKLNSACRALSNVPAGWRVKTCCFLKSVSCFFGAVPALVLGAVQLEIVLVTAEFTCA